jgi:hypothetical protein
MKRLFLIGAAMAALAPAALAAGNDQSTSPAKACKTELATIGPMAFKLLYSPGGTSANAMGKCVSKHARTAATSVANAAKACKAEQAMPEADFRAAHDGKSFAEFYGKNKNARNAYGKCVSSKATATIEALEAATLKAAKACKAERALPVADFRAAHDGQSFGEFYGKNKNDRNAYGKCVSSKSKLKKQ